MQRSISPRQVLRRASRATAASCVALLSLALVSLALVAPAAAEPGTTPLQTKAANNNMTTPWTAAVSTTNPLPEYPRPQLVRPDWQNLNGQWQFKTYAAGDTAPVNQVLPETILVPYPVQSALSGIMRNDSHVWYRRTFQVPTTAGWTGKNVMLNFGAVTQQATVWVNGTQLATHTGGYDAFSYDITPQLRPGSNELIVEAFAPLDDSMWTSGKQALRPGGIFYTASVGIWQTVWLEPVAAASAARLELIPEVANSRLRVIAATQGSGAASVTARTLDGTTVVGTATGTPNVAFTVPVPNPKLWSPSSPFLYDLQVDVKNSAGAVIDSVTSYFGMRTVALKNVNGVLRPTLNGQFEFQIGPLDQGFWPDGLYTAPTDAALRSDIEASKAFGFNMIRKHVKVEPQRWYYWADKLGILVWQDMPNMPAFRAAPAAAFQTQFELELDEMLNEHISSPAIVQWVPFNEGWGQYNVAGITNRVKTRDPSRLVDGNSGSANCCNATEPGTGDLLDTHNYPQPVGVAPTLTRASVAGEYGAIQTRSPAVNEWCPSCAPASSPAENFPSYAAATQRYQEHNATLRTLMNSPGISAGVFCCTTDVETEYDGLLTYDRRVDKMTRSTVKAENDALIAASRLLNSPAATTLNGHWKFDEGTGTSAIDSSGNGRTATFWQNPTWTSGQLGGAIALNGNNDVTVPANTINTSQSFTASAWVKLGRSDGWNTAVAADGSNVSSFMLQYGASLGNKFAMTLMHSDSTSTAVTRALSTASAVVGTWYRITGVYDRSANTISLYVNGALQQSATVPAAWTATGLGTIGRSRWGVPADRWVGSLDDVRLYQGALSAAEVAALP